jgi:hypothetical protein
MFGLIWFIMDSVPEQQGHANNSNSQVLLYTIALTDGETVNRNCKPYKQQGCMLASGKRSIAKGFS